MAAAAKKKAPAKKPKAPQAPKRPRGGQTVYTREMAEAICARIAKGESLKSICQTPGFPPDSTVREWGIDDRDGFAARFARARELGCHAIAEDCFEIADDASNDWMERLDDKGRSIGWTLNGDHVQRSRLRIDTRLRLLGKWLPKVYGDKLDLNHSGAVDLASALVQARKRLTEGK